MSDEIIHYAYDPMYPERYRLPEGYVRVPGSHEIVRRPPIRNVAPGGFVCCAHCHDDIEPGRACSDACPVVQFKQSRLVELPENELEKPRRPFWRRLRRRKEL